MSTTACAAARRCFTTVEPCQRCAASVRAAYAIPEHKCELTGVISGYGLHASHLPHLLINGEFGALQSREGRRNTTIHVQTYYSPTYSYRHLMAKARSLTAWSI